MVGSELTPEARELLTIYERVNLKTKEFVENEIENYKKSIKKAEK